MMQRALVLAIVGVFGLTALPAVGGEKCTEDAETCLAAMAAKLREKGWIGVELDYPSGKGSPPVVTRVLAESPAAAAGLQAGDVLLAIEGIPVSDPAVWDVLVPDRKVTIGLRRDGGDVSVQVHLVAIPEHIAAQWIGRHMLEHHLETEVAEAEP